MSHPGLPSPQPGRQPARGREDLQSALALQRQGRRVEAIALCERALAAGGRDDPRLAHLLGVLLYECGRGAEAVPSLERAVALSPDRAVHRINLAAVLGAAGLHERAVPHLRRAVELNPASAEAWNNLGAALQKAAPEALAAALPEAAEACQKAVRLRPAYPQAWHNLAGVMSKAGRPAAAADACRVSLGYRPGHPRTLADLATAATEAGLPEEAMAAAERLLALRPADAPPPSAMLYTMHYSPDYDAEAISRAHRRWGRWVARAVGLPAGREAERDAEREAGREAERGAGAPAMPGPDGGVPGRRLRVGYVSPDLREHTVPHFVTAAIEHRDRERFEVFCYSDAARPDAVTRRLMAMADHWRETRELGLAEMERLVRGDGIDILVDLRGHAAENRLTLFARKPAPVQVNMVGYFNTTGLEAMDWRLTDAHMDPPGRTEHLNVERLARVEPSCWCFTPDPDAPPVVEPPALARGHVTFGSLNKMVKVSAPCARLWAAVLEAVPGSRLLLSAPGDAAGAARRRLAALGLPPHRLDIVGKTHTPRQYLERFAQVDVALDTFPFNGITTTCEGLWMGVPCVSLAGPTSVSRAGKSILHAAGLGELAAETPERFIAAAAALAADPQRLCRDRLGMRDRLLASPLMDHRGFARKVDAAYLLMWQARCAGA